MRRLRSARPSAAMVMLGVAAGAAAGCTNLFHSDAKPEQTYVLRAPSAGIAAGATGGTAAADGATTDGAAGTAAAPATPLAAVQVAHPLAAPGLESRQIILVQADHRMNFYLGSRWPAPLPDMVEALAVETLRASGEWQSVQDSGSPFIPQYLLSISVRRFEADYTRARSAPQVEVVLDCTLGAREGRELIASFVAQGSATAVGDHMSEVITAFETASSAALTSMSQQAVAAGRTYAARGTAAATH